jgi:hypothetical protein
LRTLCYAYFYKTCRWISAWTVPDGLPAEKLKKETKPKSEDLKTWAPWSS